MEYDIVFASINHGEGAIVALQTEHAETQTASLKITLAKARFGLTRFFNGGDKLDDELFSTITAATPETESKLVPQITALVARGANINSVQASTGATPLNLLCAGGFYRAISRALAEGADIWCANGTAGTAMDSAAKAVNLRAIAALSEYCEENPPASDEIFTNAIKCVPLKPPAETERLDKPKYMEMTRAARSILFGTAVEIYTKKPSESGNNPALSDQIALAAAIQTGDLPAAQALLDKDVHPDSYAPYTYTVNGGTGLHAAVVNNDIPMVRALLAAKASPNLAPHNGESPMRAAVRTENFSAFILLLEAGGEDYGRNLAGRIVKPDGPTLTQLAANKRDEGFNTYVATAMKTKETQRQQETLKTMAVNKTVHVRKAPVSFKKAL